MILVLILDFGCGDGRWLMENGGHAVGGRGSIMIVERSGLCIGCGTCYGICPNEAIELTINNIEGYKIEVDKEKCVKCGLCLKVCPSVDVFEYYENDRESNDCLGSFKRVYIGYSTNEKTRYNSSSGGLATELLIFALKKGIINGALVTRMSNDNTFLAEAYLAKTEEEILAAMGSKYNISPVGSRIKEILREGGKWAVVGLPCHILAFKKASKIFKELNDSIAFYIGLLCGHTLYPQAIRFLLEKERVSIDKIKSISYRGEGWPGGMNVKLKDDQNVFLDLRYYWSTYFSSYFFTPFRCLLCNDATAELADISLGDAWLPELNDNLGTSLIISRSNIGEKLIRSAYEEGLISIERKSPSVVIRSQKSNLCFKKNLKLRLYVANKFLKRKTEMFGNIPDFCYYNPLIYLVAIPPLANSLLSKRDITYKILMRMPKIFLKLCGVTIAILNRISCNLEEYTHE